MNFWNMPVQNQGVVSAMETFENVTPRHKQKLRSA